MLASIFFVKTLSPMMKQTTNCFIERRNTMTEYMKKRMKLMAYFMLEALVGIAIVYFFWMMFDMIGVLFGSIICIGIVRKVDKMLK